MVRYQNAAITSKIRCNNSSVLALAFPLLLRFSIRLAFLGLTLRRALSFRRRAAVLLGPFPLLQLHRWHLRYARQIWYKVSVLSYFRKSSAKVGLGGYANLELRN